MTRRAPTRLRFRGALLDAPPPLADAGLDAWQEWGRRYREWYEQVRTPLLVEAEAAEQEFAEPRRAPRHLVN